MKVSIITATYNSAATLRDTLDSVLAQTYQDIEYIIVDGLSADGTQEIVKAYEPRFGGRLRLVSEKDKGLYDAMNKGLRMATGDIVGVLNSDDLFYDKQVVADVVKAFESDDIDCVYGDLEFVAANDITKVVRKWKGSQYQPGYFKRGWHPAHPTFYCRRACYEKYGYFDLDLKVSADFDLMLRFLGKHQIRNKYLSRNFIWMRTGGESNGSLRRIIQGNTNILRSFRKNGYDINGFYLVRRLTPKVWDLMKTKILSVMKGNK
ncbi:MAG: glycosyltransferase [Prevotella sp.]|jgi:glycosyltransferase involved in cell wall biosynthesis|uniref:glycosyltransferase n=1 Tax=Alloprevotella sp. TaxID=1872471 RepID=UPI0015AE84D9|nr:glycosyltransferase [Prevotella sp.]MBD9035857.1 glycosyltransferase [Prevotella sp.]MEE0448051.1 glycosyltransferase family 2 protein [Prevotellamassilia sp.]